jgi:hypothetical protein
MDAKMVEDIRRNWADKSNDELIQIWKENDHERWSEAAFEAARQILMERGVELPQQYPPKVVKKIAVPQKSRHRTSARIFTAIVVLYWVMVFIVYAVKIVGITNKYLPLFGPGMAIFAASFWYIELGRKELRTQLPLVIGLLCAVLTFAALAFIPTAIVEYAANPSYVLGQCLPVVIFGFLAYFLSFK